jgi:hypothetical protein
MKLIGDPNSPARFKDDATADELLAEVMRHIARLTDAGIIDLEALPAPKRPVSNWSIEAIIGHQRGSIGAASPCSR